MRVTIDKRWSSLAMPGLPERLKELRNKRKLTQTRLAELLKVSARVYNRWEKGTAAPHLDTVIKIADILQVDLDDLVGRKPTESDFLIHNQRLHQLCKQIDRLPDEEQQALIIVMDGLVKRRRLAEVLTEQ